MLVLAPFGAFALCNSQRDYRSHLHGTARPMKTLAKRYTAAVSCGAIYTVLIGLFGAAVTGLLTAFPKELVVAIAGLALLGSIGSGLAVALKDETHREAALITFLVTLSGVVNSRDWLGVSGASSQAAIALFVQQYGSRTSRSG
jgi:benzoate membrane transport protein